MAGDEGIADRKKRQLNWDKKKKRFVQGDRVGADNVKLVKTESGMKLPATYRSGRFDEWKSKSRVSLPRTGEAENTPFPGRKLIGKGGQRFKHNKIVPSKPLDKLSTDYERKVRQFKKREEAGGQGSLQPTSKKGIGRYGGKPYGQVKTELKTTDQIRKSRQIAEKKRAKNARPGKSSKRKGRR